MRGDSIRDFYAKTLALLGLGVLAGTGALVDYWPASTRFPVVSPAFRPPDFALAVAAAPVAGELPALEAITSAQPALAPHVAPAIELLQDVASGFRDLIPLAAQCRFTDCRHLREPGCAIREAVTSGTLAPRRYESYRRLLRLSEDLAPEPGSKRS